MPEIGVTRNAVASTVKTLRAENAELRARLEEAEEMLRAIRVGEVDALVVETAAGPKLFTLQGIDSEQNRMRGEMLAQVSDAVVTVDNEERITFLNAAAERQYGVSASDVLGLELTQMLTRLWPSPETEAGMWTALGEHGEWRGELIHRTLDGRELHVEASVTALLGPDGERAGVIRTIRDVSERTKLQDEKSEALRLLDTLLTRAPIGFVFLDRDLRFVRINERLADINGLSVAAHLGRTVAEILPTLEATLREVTARILATGQPVLDQEFTGETARDAGIIRSWNQSWYPVHDERGEIIGFGGVVEEITERKRAEEALQHNERRFRGIFDSAFQFIGLMTPDGTLLEANRTALEGGGLRAEDVIGKPFWECDWWTLTEQTGRELRTAIGRAASGELVRYDVDVRGAEGQVITIDLSIKPIRDEAGRVVLLIPEGRDITGLKQAEENLRLTNQRFDLAVKCSQVFLWQQDLELRFTWLHNPAPGIDDLNPVGKRDEDLLERSEDAAVIVGLKREVIETGSSLRKEFFPHIQGVRRCFDLLMEPLRDAAGLIIGITGAAIDITDRKRAEEDLRESRGRLAATQAHAPIGIVETTLDGRYLSVNDEFCRISGYSRADLPNLRIREVTNPDDWPRENQLFERLAAGQISSFEMEKRFHGKDGSTVWADVHHTLLRDADGTPQYVIGAILDITERIRSQEALREAEGATRKRQLLESLVQMQEVERRRIARDLHDNLGQQLTALRLALGDLGKAAVNIPDCLEKIEKTKASAERLDQDVSMLAFTLHASMLNERGLAEALEIFIASWSRNHHIPAEFEVVGKAARGRFPDDFQTHLYRIAQEALNNTLKYAHASSVSVVLDGSNSKLQLIIEDNGVGFSPGRKGKTSRRPSGGMGLRNMRERVELLGGSLEIESKPGAGTTVYVAVPIPKQAK